MTFTGIPTNANEYVHEATVGDWRTIFLFLGVVGVAMTTLAFLGIPETLPV